MVKLPIGVDINNLIDDLRIFSWEASDILLYYSKIIKNSKDKKNIIQNCNFDDPVTIADLRVNEMIIKKINQKYKDIDWEILSEENVKEKFIDVGKKVDWLWVLDPLDGTKDFIQGTGNYAMHLALNFKQKPFIGIVLIPEKDELWISDGEKVWCERKNKSKLSFNMSIKNNLQDINIVTSKNHGNQNLRKLIKKVNFKKITVMGSIGCKIASIMRGESDMYISLSLPNESSPKDWDFAAPEAILKAAGGSITNIDNEELSYNQLKYEQSGIIVASNNKNSHKKLCLQLKEVIAENNIYPFLS